MLCRDHGGWTCQCWLWYCCTLYKQHKLTRHFEKGNLKQPVIYPGIHCFRLHWIFSQKNPIKWWYHYILSTSWRHTWHVNQLIRFMNCDIEIVQWQTTVILTPHNLIVRNTKMSGWQNLRCKPNSASYHSTVNFKCGPVWITGTIIYW